jgi:ribonuclease R
MVDLKDDFYDYDRENYRIIGQRNGKVFTFGDKLQVKVKECNLARRSMDLLLVGGEGRVRKDKGKSSRARDSRHKSSDSRSAKGGKRSSSKDSGKRRRR